MTRVLALTIASALVISIVTISVPAQSRVEPKAAASQTLAEHARNEKVKVDVTRLVADAKAGKIVPRNSQSPQHQRNNLSTTAKIAIVAGIALVVLAIIVIHSVRNIGCESRCVL